MSPKVADVLHDKVMHRGDSAQEAGDTYRHRHHDNQHQPQGTSHTQHRSYPHPPDYRHQHQVEQHHHQQQKALVTTAYDEAYRERGEKGDDSRDLRGNPESCLQQRLSPPEESLAGLDYQRRTSPQGGQARLNHSTNTPSGEGRSPQESAPRVEFFRGTPQDPKTESDRGTASQEHQAGFDRRVTSPQEHQQPRFDRRETSAQEHQQPRFDHRGTSPQEPQSRFDHSGTSPREHIQPRFYHRGTSPQEQLKPRFYHRGTSSQEPQSRFDQRRGTSSEASQARFHLHGEVPLQDSPPSRLDHQTGPATDRQTGPTTDRRTGPTTDRQTGPATSPSRERQSSGQSADCNTGDSRKSPSSPLARNLFGFATTHDSPSSAAPPPPATPPRVSFASSSLFPHHTMVTSTPAQTEDSRKNAQR